MFEALLRSVMRRVRGRDLKLADGVSAVSVLTHLLSKGAMPFLRGSIWKLKLGTTSGPVFVGRGCKVLSPRQLHVGRNFYLGNYAYLDCFSRGGIHAGDNVTIREGAWAQLTSRYDNPGTSITIGSNVYIGPRSILGAAAPLVIGDHCQIGANVSFVAENHQFEGEGEIFDMGVTRRGITLGKDVWVGNNVTILDGVTVGDGTVIGAGTVLTRSVGPRSVVVGVPGRVIKTR